MAQSYPDIRGRLLTEPHLDGFLRVEPVANVNGFAAMRVRVFTPGGVVVIDERVTDIEVTRISIPVAKPFPHVESKPGATWFYAPPDAENPEGKDIGFLSEAAVAVLAMPGAVESGRIGRHERPESDLDPSAETRRYSDERGKR